MVTALCCTAWKKIFEGWELRNTHVHGHDAVTAAAATKKKLFTKIKLLNSHQNEALEHGRQYLIPDLRNFFRTATPTTMQNWLNTYEPVHLESFSISAMRAVANIRRLHHYFPSTRIPPKRNPKPRHSARIHSQPEHRKKTRKKAVATPSQFDTSFGISYAPVNPPLPNLQHPLPTSCPAPGNDMSFPLPI
jgi:hypothetical protein